ncbi:putative epoxide hydrolase [Rhodocollybia butyracea]|uniref:Epoxide hydrolase n=1 Tax=Rhodocollybia butyracea TaxID=206335 RepID=A0A9P5Q897_9AGAR|nr:putative epoxide hydrolase [Rhodocollybia butyracea]
MDITLPPGIVSKNNPTSSSANAPLIILLHGFPELAYSWREVMPKLSEAGYNVVAPDQRGYGRTTMVDSSGAPQTGPVHFDDDLAPFRMFNLVTDIVLLVAALGYQSVAAVIGHDFGSAVAGYCALIRPDLFRSVVIMSAPFQGVPPFSPSTGTPAIASILKQLAELTPPRKHYTMYYSTPNANSDMLRSPQGLHSFLADNFYAKSADWPINNPHRLPSASASNLATLPHYYIMLLEQTMPMAVRNAVNEGTRSLEAWLPQEDLAFYVSEYSRTGFQGGLNWYRCMTDPKWNNEMKIFTGKVVEVPAMFLSGNKDWGVYQSPGALEDMKERVCKHMDDDDLVLVPDAGHWVQQEQSEAVVEHLKRFLAKVSPKE